MLGRVPSMDGCSTQSGSPCVADMAIKEKTVKAKAPITSLDSPGLLRVCNLMALYNISRPTLYRRLLDGLIPPPDGKDGSKPYWSNQTIKHHLDRLSSSKQVSGHHLTGTEV